MKLFQSRLAAAVLIAASFALSGHALAAPGKGSSPNKDAPAKPAKSPPSPNMMFYIAKGAPDSCGRGCDTWIAAEGQIDGGTAGRMRRFLAQHKDKSLPIYFFSPGGNVDQSLQMGRLLRARNATARVGRTLVKACEADKQFDKACLKLKQAGGVLDSDLAVRGSICASACSYAFLGATTREVSPEVVFGVHSGKIFLRFSGPVAPPAEVRAAFLQRSRNRSDLAIASYMLNMGVSPDLYELAKTIKFESMHAVTRDELYRFKVDQRDFIDLPWKFESGSQRRFAFKLAIERNDAKNTFRKVQWSAFCLTSERFLLEFRRQTDGAALLAPRLTLAGLGPTPLEFVSRPTGAAVGQEVWYLPMSKTLFQSFIDKGEADFVLTALGDNSRPLRRAVKLSTLGLTQAMTKVNEACPAAAPNNKDAQPAAEARPEANILDLPI